MNEVCDNAAAAEPKDATASRVDPPSFASMFPPAIAEQLRAPTFEKPPRPPEPKVKREKFPKSENRHSRAPAFVPQRQLDQEIAYLERIAKRSAEQPELLDKLRQELAERPHLVHYLGDLQRQIELKIIVQAAPGDLVRREAFRQRCSQFRAAILKSCDTPLMQLAASRIVTCWMFTQLLDLLGSTLSGAAHQKVLLQAEKRLESAYRSLEIARRISVPQK